MKKKVRIYKAPDGKGKYVNKTSKFLAKAQMGGTPDPSMLAYPGSQPAQQQNQTDQLIQFVVNDITNQVPKEKTLFKLVNIMGVPVDAATQLYVTIAEKLTEDIEREDDRTYEEETGQPRKKETPLTKDAIITENPEEDIDYDLFDDTGADIAMEDSQEPDILDESLDPLTEEQYGGTISSYQNGGEYNVALPDIDSYESLVEPMTGYDLISEMAWNSNKDSNSPYLEKEYANTTLDYSKLQKGGSYKKSKKKYVNSVMNLLKKQMGGTNGSDVDPNQGDPTGSNFRDGKLKSFTNSLKQTAEMSAMQNQIEQQYDQMMQEGGMTMPEQDVENPMHHLQLYSQAARGIFGEPMNEQVKARKGLFIKDDDLPVQNENLLNVPRGFYRRSMRRFGNIPNLREVDVRKSGLFGPKQYTMYFDPMPLQQLSNPLAAQMYGYGSNATASRKYTRTFDAVKTYTNLAADAVNQESLKEVDKNTPGNEATTVKEDVASGPTAPVVAKPKPKVASAPVPVVQETVMRDEWGRPSTSKWYGFNAKTKTWDPKYGPHRYMFDPAPGVTNIARGIASYKESPYVTAFRNQTDNTINSLLFKQTGGIIQDPFSNPMEPLQRFVGGGYDPSIPDLTENDIQYTNSKDITDAYMQGGGFIKNFIPANLTRSSRNDIIQRVYNPLTGETRQGGPGPGNYISAIDVRKRGITGAPKKYTIYYGAAGDPRYQDLITLDDAKDTSGRGSKSTKASEREQALKNAGYGDRTDVTGLKAKSKAAIRKGERQRDRELEKLYKEDPTNVEFTKIDQNAPFDYETIMPAPLPIRSAQDELNKLIKQGPEHIATQEEIDALKDQLNMDYVPSRAKYNDPRGIEANKLYPDWFDPSGKVTDQTATRWDAYDTDGEDPETVDIVDQSGNFINPSDAPYYGIDKDPNMLPDPRMTSDFSPMSMQGPLATAEDQVPTFEEQYMDGFKPTITQEMIDQAAGLTIPQEPINMGAWSGMDYPADIIQPGVNPFELPIGGGQDYYPPFAQPIEQSIAPIVQPKPKPVTNNGGKSLDQLRAEQRRNPNAGKNYTFTLNMSGIEKDPEYIRAMQNARKDGVVTNQEAEGARRAYKQRQAEQEKAKIATQAQRTINQIMSSSASPAEKNAAREKVVLQMQQRFDLIDRTVGSRKYGGALSRFVGGGDNQPFTGENPVAYTNNPAMQGKSDLDLISLNPGIQGAQGQVNWGSMSSPGMVNQKNNDGTTTYGVDATYKGPQTPEIKIDPMQREEYQVPKTYAEPLAIDVKNKLSQGEREARLIAGNTLMRGVAGFKNRIDDSKQMADFYDNFSADNIYASDPSKDTGDYTEAGLYRPNEQGQTWYGRSAQMGGYIDDDFEDGEEVYMTDEEIKEYMANGGQIEFI